MNVVYKNLPALILLRMQEHYDNDVERTLKLHFVHKEFDKIFYYFREAKSEPIEGRDVWNNIAYLYNKQEHPLISPLISPINYLQPFIHFHFGGDLGLFLAYQIHLCHYDTYPRNAFEKLADYFRVRPADKMPLWRRTEDFFLRISKSNIPLPF